MKPTSHTQSGITCLARGFTLMEILMVVLVVTLIFSFSTPFTLSVIQSASLTSAGDTLMQKLSHAQQLAVTQNRPVGVNFYFYAKHGTQGCHAIQLVSYDPASNQSSPLEPPVYWGEGRVILVNGPLTPVFSGKLAASDTGAAASEPFASLEATFKRILFYPNGTTSLRVPLRDAYLTLVSIRNYKEELTDPPPTTTRCRSIPSPAARAAIVRERGICQGKETRCICEGEGFPRRQNHHVRVCHRIEVVNVFAKRPRHADATTSSLAYDQP